MTTHEPRVAIVDLGICNAGSIANMLTYLGIAHQRIELPTGLQGATHIILPGVGTFDAGMAALKNSDMIPELERLVLKMRVPLLGICLGMQLLGVESEEGSLKGLGWIKGRSQKLQREGKGSTLRIPHIGWNHVTFQPDAALGKGLETDARFYFVHSYTMVLENNENRLCSTHYGATFVSGVFKNNIYGVQFHPEKSHRYGLRLLQNFCGIGLK
jgi:glutamine amidotransferase